MTIFPFSPGRYFACNELKTILGQIILNYDLKLPGDGSRPADVYFVGRYFPRRTAVSCSRGGSHLPEKP